MTQRASAVSIDNRYRRPAPTPTPRRHSLPTYDVEVHVQGCDCPYCVEDDRLSFAALGNLALAAVLVGSAIAFAIDPAGAWTALADLAWSFGR